MSKMTTKKKVTWDDQTSDDQWKTDDMSVQLLLTAICWYAENQRNPDSILVEIQLSDIDISTSDKPGNLLQILGTAWTSLYSSSSLRKKIIPAWLAQTFQKIWNDSWRCRHWVNMAVLCLCLVPTTYGRLWSILRTHYLSWPGLMLCVRRKVSQDDFHSLKFLVLGWDRAHLVRYLISFHRHIFPLNVRNMYKYVFCSIFRSDEPVTLGTGELLADPLIDWSCRSSCSGWICTSSFSWKRAGQIS